VKAARQEAAETKDRYWLHILLFVLTLLGCIYAGYLLVGRGLLYREMGLERAVMDGLMYAAPLLIFLTVHEFGHFLAARYHQVRTSWPYYIPAFFPGMLTLGTFGAVIRIREPVPNIRKLFDIGVGGPIAGFVVALGVLIYALATLPPPEYLLDVPGHEALKAYIMETGRFPEQPLTATDENSFRLYVGYTPLYWMLSQLFSHVPPMYEVHHYPVLFAGWLGLFFTALNLLPVGQLDGGHILYALVGRRWHSRLARGIVMVLLLSGSIGFMKEMGPVLAGYADWSGGLDWFILAGILYLFLKSVFGGNHRQIAPALLGLILVTLAAEYAGPALTKFGWTGWFVWCILIVAFIKIDHPPVLYHEPLDRRRRILGIVAMVIFILCFSIRPLYVG
jgi:Zn-dependent protease